MVAPKNAPQRGRMIVRNPNLSGPKAPLPKMSTQPKKSPPPKPPEPIKVTINDDEEVWVDPRSEEKYFSFADGAPEAAVNCPGCKMVTVQECYEVKILAAISGDPYKVKRVYVCTSCAHVYTR